MSIESMDHRLKLARAKHHLDELKQSMQDAGRATFHELMPEPGAIPGRYVVRATYSEPPPTWSLIAGDAFHNLRSALDSLAFALSVKHSGPLTEQQESEVAFPICKSRKSFDDFRGVRHVSGEVRAVMESVQPYRPTRWIHGSPLLAVQKLSNVDKHRRIMFIRSDVVDGYVDVFRWNHEMLLKGVPLRTGAIRSGDIIAEFELPVGVTLAETYLQYRVGRNFVIDGAPLVGVPHVEALVGIIYSCLLFDVIKPLEQFLT